MATLRPFAADDAPWVIEAHAIAYARDEGFDGTFRDVVARIVADFTAHARPGRDAGWIACDARGQRLGSVFVVDDGAGAARLRLFLLLPESRGTGLAQAMIDTALNFARTAGYGRMVLWTHESHVAAGRLYARNGFALTHAESRHSFGRDVVAQTWAKEL